MLLLHGESDNDVHITQSEELYTALKERGVETALVRYPREGHGATEPRHQLDRDTVLEMMVLHMPQENYEKMFETFVRWARFGDLFAYDENTEEITPS